MSSLYFAFKIFMVDMHPTLSFSMDCAMVLNVLNIFSVSYICAIYNLAVKFPVSPTTMDLCEGYFLLVFRSFLGVISIVV